MSIQSSLAAHRSTAAAAKLAACQAMSEADESTPYSKVKFVDGDLSKATSGDALAAWKAVCLAAAGGPDLPSGSLASSGQCHYPQLCPLFGWARKVGNAKHDQVWRVFEAQLGRTPSLGELYFFSFVEGGSDAALSAKVELFERAGMNELDGSKGTPGDYRAAGFNPNPSLTPDKRGWDGPPGLVVELAYDQHWFGADFVTDDAIYRFMDEAAGQKAGGYSHIKPVWNEVLWKAESDEGKEAWAAICNAVRGGPQLDPKYWDPDGSYSSNARSGYIMCAFIAANSTKQATPDPFWALPYAVRSPGWHGNAEGQGPNGPTDGKPRRDHGVILTPAQALHRAPTLAELWFFGFMKFQDVNTLAGKVDMIYAPWLYFGKQWKGSTDPAQNDPVGNAYNDGWGSCFGEHHTVFNEIEHFMVDVVGNAIAHVVVGVVANIVGTVANVFTFGQAGGAVTGFIKGVGDGAINLGNQLTDQAFDGTLSMNAIGQDLKQSAVISVNHAVQGAVNGELSTLGIPVNLQFNVLGNPPAVKIPGPACPVGPGTAMHAAAAKRGHKSKTKHGVHAKRVKKKAHLKHVA